MGVTVLWGCAAPADGSGPSTAPVAIARLDVSRSSVTLEGVGRSEAVTATPRRTDGTTAGQASVAWVTSNPAVVEVLGSGTTATLVARGRGRATVSASAGAARTSLEVTVLGVSTVRLSPGSATLMAGHTLPLAVSVDADPGIRTEVTFASANPSVATVDSAGLVTAVAEGVTTIRATALADPRVSGTMVLSVTRRRTLAVTPEALRIGPGERRTLAAVVDGTPSQDIRWFTDNPNIATVNAAGLVTAVQFGATQIVAVHPADSAIRQAIPVRVEPMARDVSVVPAVVSMLAGGTRQLIADVTADAGVSQAVTWRSSNPAVAQVSQTGLVTAVGAGAAQISALSVADTTVRGTALVSVVVGPSTVAITPRDVGVFLGQGTTLTATVTGPEGVVRDLTWTSSAPSIATVDGTGRVSALALGTTVVTATSTVDPTRRDTVTVTVVPRVATTWSATRLGGPLADRIVSLYAPAPTVAFAVDVAGDLYRFDGVGWSRAVTGAAHGTTLQAVHGASATEVIAVGTGGVAVRFDGTGWSAMTTGTTRTLLGVHVAAPGNAVAVGAQGTAIRLAGTTWTSTSTGVSSTLRAVWSTGGASFAVGDGGVALRWIANAWERLHPPTTEALASVWASSPSAVIVAGTGGTLLSFNGATWTDRSTGTIRTDLRAVVGAPAAPDQLLVAGEEGVWQLAGGTLTALATPYPPDVHALQVDASGALWVAGERGMVLRRSGSTWSTLNLVPDLLDVWATSDDDAWAVGEFGFVFRWRGGTWSRQPTPTSVRLNTVWGADASTAFAGGDFGTMLRWTGSAWTAMSIPTTADVLGLWGSGPSRVFAVTSDGEVLRFDGNAWSTVLTVPVPLFAVFGSGPDDVYVAGDRGVVRRFDGSSWQALDTPGDPLLTGIWATGTPRMEHVVGADGATLGTGIALRRGSAWTPTALPNSQVLTSIWGLSRFELFATRTDGGIIRWDGSTWVPMASGTSEFLWSVSGSPTGTGGAFAVGWNGTVVRGVATGSMAGRAVRPAEPRLAGNRPGVGPLEPSAAASSRRLPSRPAPVGSARRSLPLMHAPSARGSGGARGGAGHDRQRGRPTAQ